MSCRTFCIALLGGLSVFAGGESLRAQESRLTSTIVQDEPRSLPGDNTALFSRADRRVKLQLVKLAGGAGEMLAGTKVKVIGPAGEDMMVTADEQGVATIENAKPGLHAVVVAGEKGHSAIPIALRESTAEVASAVPTVRLPLVDVNPKEVVRLTNSYLSPNPSGEFTEIDQDFVTKGNVSEGLSYRVQLGDEGTLDGRVYSLLRDGLSSSGVAGTNILIYQGNNLVGRTIADDNGRFTMNNMAPGVYGLVGAGPAGYASFAFEAYNALTVAESTGKTAQQLVSTAARSSDEQFASTLLAPGGTLPVILIPPPMLPGVLEQIRLAGGVVDVPADGFVGDPAIVPPGSGVGAAPFSAGGFPTTGTPLAGGGFGGAPVGASGIGGLGELLGLAAIGGITAAAIEASSDGENDFIIPDPPTNAQL